MESAHDRDVLLEVREAALEVAFALVAQALHGGHEHGDGRLDARGRHHQVHVLLEAEVGGEAGFIHDVVGEAQADLVRDDGAGSVRDIGEGPAMHHRRCAFGGLREVRQQWLR